MLILQDEFNLLCRVATTRDRSAGLQLSHTTGWATLSAILNESGERPLKRPMSPVARPGYGVGRGDGGAMQHHSPDSSRSSSVFSPDPNRSDAEHLAKKVKRFSLTDP
jgi:nuclear protein localization protein 4 homolog